MILFVYVNENELELAFEALRNKQFGCCQGKKYPLKSLPHSLAVDLIS
jgi:hypothetical protein